MKPCADLRDFIALLEERNELKRIHHPVSPHLEITEISRRVLASGGPALLFARPVRADGSRYEFPLLANLLAHRHGLLSRWELKIPASCVISAACLPI